MRASLLIVVILLVVQSCDAPQKVRYPDSNETVNNLGKGVGDPTTAPDTEEDDNDSDDDDTAGNGSELAAGFEGCNTNPSFYNTGIGYISMCQHTSIESKIRVKFTTTDQSQGTCFIPLFKDTSGNSTYLGSAQCTKHNDGQVVYGDIPKTRSGFTQYPINGVMVLKYSASNAFYQCMNAYNYSYNSCAGNCYGNSYCLGSCQTSATNYMTQLCNNFRNNNSYIDISF